MELIKYIITLLVGSAIFITGMNMMSSGLKKATGKGLKKLIKSTQNNRFACLGMGAGVTAIIQSSAATCVMAIGFINTGIMTIFQGVNIMMGAYIGTTVTGILVSLSSFPFSTFFTLFAFLGVILMFFNNYKVKNIGEILCGLGLLFFGLSTMSGVFNNSLQINEFLSNLFTVINFPLLLMLIGLIFSALIQSSSATTGIAIVMVGSGVIPFSSALYIALGSTIGTSISTILATIGGTVNAKRAGLASTIIKIVTGLTAVFLVWIFEEPVANFFRNSFGSAQMGVALFSLIFNIIFMGLISPFVKPIINLSNKLIKDKDLQEKQKAIKYIDDRFIKTPDIALEEIKNEVFNNMIILAKDNFIKGFDYLVYGNKPENDKSIAEIEENIDYINKQLSEYLIKVTSVAQDEQAKLLASYFHVINDIERIGDHAYNFYETAKYMEENDFRFSKDAQAELQTLKDEILNMFEVVNDIDFNNNIDRLAELHEIEELTDKQSKEYANNHFVRVTLHKCDSDYNGLYSTVLSELERIADHLTNIGYLKINPTGDEEY